MGSGCSTSPKRLEEMEMPAKVAETRQARAVIAA
jgi:hypothetical protein